MTILEKIEIDYPLPYEASIWNLPGNSVEEFVKLCLSDLQSDLEIYDHIPITGLVTSLPEGTRAVSAVKLTQPFQGNRFVKKTFDLHNNTLLVNAYPAVATIKRNVTMADIDGTNKKQLEGARAQYLRMFIIEKMLAKEIAYLTSIKLNSDVGEVDIEGLKSIQDKYQTDLKEMKEDIMIYSGE